MSPDEKLKKQMAERKEINIAKRPKTYSDELADEICERLSGGESMHTICQGERMPNKSTVFGWIRSRPEFREMYERAKREAADAMFEELMDIADDGSNDWMESNDPDNPGYKYNKEAMQRSRLRVDTRKWALSKIMPSKFGERVQQEVSGPGGGPVQSEGKWTVEFVNASKDNE